MPNVPTKITSEVLRTAPILTAHLSVANIFLSTDKNYPSASIIRCNPRHIAKITEETKGLSNFLKIKGYTIIVPGTSPGDLKKMAKKALKPLKEKTKRKIGLQKLSCEFLSENKELAQALWLYEIVPCKDEPEHSLIRIEKSSPEYSVFKQFPNHFIFTKSGMIKIKGFTPFEISKMVRKSIK